MACIEAFIQDYRRHKIPNMNAWFGLTKSVDYEIVQEKLLYRVLCAYALIGKLHKYQWKVA